MNSRPHGPEPCALPAALHPVKPVYYNDCSGKCQEKNTRGARLAKIPAGLGLQRVSCLAHAESERGDGAKAPERGRLCGQGDKPSDSSGPSLSLRDTSPRRGERQECFFCHWQRDGTFPRRGERQACDLRTGWPEIAFTRMLCPMAVLIS